MRFVRYQDSGGRHRYGWVLDDQIGPLEGTPFQDYRRMELERPIETVRLLAPVTPGKIICVGRNYAAHVKEMNNTMPEIPIIFLKPPSSLIGPGDPIVLPPQSSQIDHEAELAIIIGKTARWIQPEESKHYILGYTRANDVTARDLQRRDGQWTRAKGFDSFCPLGPWIETDFNPADALISCHVNDELRQMVSTKEMIFTIPQLLAFISSVMTLFPGDVVLTGTPAGVGPIVPGDTLSITIEDIGTLINPVKAS
jgi:2-keto-4-pentenoate hydratase/2-oxohepta-3-ene-1,7-dioic acid hydratase in catechol pathway